MWKVKEIILMDYGPVDKSKFGTKGVVNFLNNKKIKPENVKICARFDDERDFLDCPFFIFYYED